MDRILMLRLQTQGCCAEVRVNDIPLGRVGVISNVLFLPIHEYVLAGMNSISLVINPPPTDSSGIPAVPKVADDDAAASLRLLLPRMDQLGSLTHSRILAELDWSVTNGQVYKSPTVVSSDVSLPIKFPRWRWLDAPEIVGVETIKPAVTSFIQDLAIGMATGEADGFVNASRLRLEELALAYQQPVAEMAARLRSRLQLLHATKAMKMVIPAISDLTLRLCANGRMLECLGPAGEPALRTENAPDGSRTSWPIRLAVVNGQFLILR
jgi:hypothetical protein